LRKRQRRLRLLRLGLARYDLRLLRRDLRLEVLHVCLSLTHGRFSLFKGDSEVCGVDHQQQVALVHELIVGHRQLDDTSCDLRRLGDHIGTHRAVTRPRRPHIRVPHRPTERRGKRDGPQSHQNWNHPEETTGWAA
jgi:hypothetical protein